MRKGELTSAAVRAEARQIFTELTAEASHHAVSAPLYVFVVRALIRDRGNRVIDQAGHEELIRLIAGLQQFFDGLTRTRRRQR